MQDYLSVIVSVSDRYFPVPGYLINFLCQVDYTQMLTNILAFVWTIFALACMLIGLWYICKTIWYLICQVVLLMIWIFFGSPEGLNSYIISKFSHTVASNCRTVFKSTNIKSVDTKAKERNHSHGVAATIRTFANEFIEEVCSLSGLNPYSISMSRTDQIKNKTGQRYFYWPKDLYMSYRDDVIPRNACCKLIDVDYYADMNAISREFDHIMAYTFVPKLPGGSIPDGTFSIADDTVTVNVNGGAEYNHQMWYYNRDQIFIRTWWGGKLMLVELKDCPSDGNDSDHKVVLLTTVCKIYGPAAWFFSETGLVRRKFSHGAFNATRSNEEVGGKWQIFKHFSMRSSSISMSLTEQAIEAAYTRVSRAKTPATSDVERILLGYNMTPQSACHAASMFMSIYETQPELLMSQPQIITKYIGSSYMYVPLGPLLTEDAKPTMRELPVAVFPAAWYPGKSYNSDNSCIDHRVMRVGNKVTTVPQFYNECAEDFLQMLLTPIGHNGYASTLPTRSWFLTPASYDEVRERQSTGLKRSLLDRAREWLFHGTRTFSTFIKSEAYGKIAPPRNISNPSIDTKSRLAAFMHPLCDVIKQHHFYVFGKSPLEISHLMNAKASASKHAICTDYSKFDGSHSAFLSRFECSLYLRAYPPAYHREINDLLDTEVHAKCYTQHGLKYDNGFSRVSGSMHTSLMNTVNNALLSYIMYRLQKLEKRTAYESLGLYGGDDGVNFDLDATHVQSVAKRTGLTITSDIVPNGHPIKFLGRVFFGSVSICDVFRQLSKFHLTTSPAIVPLTTVLRRKAEAYLITDPLTPIIGKYCATLLSFLPSEHSKDKSELADPGNWWSQYSKYDERFVYPEADDERIKSYVANEFRLTSADIDNFNQRLDDCETLDDVLAINLASPEAPQATISATLKDEVLLVPLKPTTITSHMSKTAPFPYQFGDFIQSAPNQLSLAITPLEELIADVEKSTGVTMQQVLDPKPLANLPEVKTKPPKQPKKPTVSNKPKKTSQPKQNWPENPRYFNYQRFQDMVKPLDDPPAAQRFDTKTKTKRDAPLTGQEKPRKRSGIVTTPKAKGSKGGQTPHRTPHTTSLKQ